MHSGSSVHQEGGPTVRGAVSAGPQTPKGRTDWRSVCGTALCFSPTDSSSTLIHYFLFVSFSFVCHAVFFFFLVLSRGNNLMLELTEFTDGLHVRSERKKRQVCLKVFHLDLQNK